MSSIDYIPANDAQFSLWVQAFSNGIVADPPRFGLTAGEAASIQATVVDFEAALLVSTTEGTRTKGTVAAKDDARSICETLCRQFVGCALHTFSREPRIEPAKVGGAQPTPHRHGIEKRPA